MALRPKASGIDVAIHSTVGCGNPCHPGQVCSSCEGFWQSMQATGRFNAYVPPTFDGSAVLRKPLFGGTKIEFADLKFRKKGSNS